jgi:hypothetical protein
MRILYIILISLLFSSSTIAQENVTTRNSEEITSPWEVKSTKLEAFSQPFVDLTDESRYPPGSVVSVPQTAVDAPTTVSYFRIDHDYALGLQLWAGATHFFNKSIGIATDIFMTDGQLPAYKGASYSWYGEFDIGPSFASGTFTITPMVGIGMDWGAKHAMLINGPQIYSILNGDKIYIESWVWLLLYSPFHEAPSPDVFHTRDWILYRLNDTISAGPQIEVWSNTKQKSISGIDYKSGITSMPIGGHVDISYGSNNTLGLFLGYESNKFGRDVRNGNATTGRLTFIHNF